MLDLRGPHICITPDLDISLFYHTVISLGFNALFKKRFLDCVIVFRHFYGICLKKIDVFCDKRYVIFS